MSSECESIHNPVSPMYVTQGVLNGLNDPVEDDEEWINKPEGDVEPPGPPEPCQENGVRVPRQKRGPKEPTEQ